MDGAVETEAKPAQSTEVETKPVHTRRMALGKLVGAAALGGVAAALLPHEHAEASHNAADNILHLGQNNLATNMNDGNTTVNHPAGRRLTWNGDVSGSIAAFFLNQNTGGGMGASALNATIGGSSNFAIVGTASSAGSAGVTGTTEGQNTSLHQGDSVGVWGAANTGIGVAASSATGTGLDVQTGGAKAIHAQGGRVEVQNSNAEYRLIGSEASGRTWRLFSDGTSFNFRDETGAQNILIVATDAVQFTKRLLPVGDAVAGMDLGIVGARWNSVRALNVFSGDLHFENGVTMTEESTGLAFKNPDGQKIAVLDADGNLRIKGKVIEEAV